MPRLGSPAAAIAALRGAWEEGVAVARKIVGMPDYQAYVRHLRDRHPDRCVPSEGQYFEEYLRARYEGGPTRCC